MSNMKGFTLLELLVAMGIIGILAAIAFPQFARYRERSYDAHARHDLRNAAHGEELYFIDAELYMTCNDTSCLEVNGGLPGLKDLSETVTLDMVANNSGDPSFTGSATSTLGTGNVYEWKSDTEGEGMRLGGNVR